MSVAMPRYDLSGKVAVVTGAAGGLGKEFSDRILRAGGRVCLADVNEALGRATLTEFEERYGGDKVCFARCDVTKKEDVAKV